MQKLKDVNESVHQRKKKNVRVSEADEFREEQAVKVESN